MAHTEHMDSESGLVIGRSQRERKRSYRDFLLDVEDVQDPDSSDQEFSTVVTHEEPEAAENQMRPFCINGREESYHPGLAPVALVQASWDGWRGGGGEKYGAVENNLLHTVSPTEGAIEEPGSPLAGYWVYLNDKYTSFESTLTGHSDLVTNHSPILSMPCSQAIPESPVNYTEGGTSLCDPITDQASVSHSPSACGSFSGSDLVAVNAAAHLHLMGESLALIGHELQETDKAVCASSSMSLLMDSMLCALVPLVSLTSLMPQFRGVPQHALADAMENIAYMMPGL